MLNNRIKELRKSMNMSQQDIEKRIGYSQSMIARWEKGLAEPTLPALKELAKCFNCTIDYIAGIESEDGIIVVSGNELSKDEEHLLDITRQLPPKEKDMVYRLAETLYEYIKK